MLDHTYAKSLVDPSLPSTPAILENVASTSSLSEGLSLAEKYLSGGVKDSTCSQYDRVYLIWRHFCAENGLPELDAGHAALAALSLHHHGSIKVVVKGDNVVSCHCQSTSNPSKTFSNLS